MNESKLKRKQKLLSDLEQKKSGSQERSQLRRPHQGLFPCKTIEGASKILGHTKANTELGLKFWCSDDYRGRTTRPTSDFFQFLNRKLRHLNAYLA